MRGPTCLLIVDKLDPKFRQTLKFLKKQNLKSLERPLREREVGEPHTPPFFYMLFSKIASILSESYENHNAFKVFCLILSDFSRFYQILFDFTGFIHI